MKRKNLIVKRKVEKKILLNKNLKIRKIYKKFRTIISNNIGRNSFALGVSGGPDSMCLAYFSKLYRSEFKNKI